MMRVFMAAAVVGAAVPPTAQAAAQELPVTWSAALDLATLKDIPKRLEEEHFVVTLVESWRPGSDSRTVKTCSQYLRAREDGFHAGDNFVAHYTDQYDVECGLLRLLMRARPAKRTFIPASGWTDKALDEVPPLLACCERSVTDAAETAAAAGLSWARFRSSMTQTVNGERDELVADDGPDGFAYSLRILARADFNDDGVQDIAVRACMNAKRGTYHFCKLVLLTRTADGARMKQILK
jgi:hypothetical protein